MEDNSIVSSHIYPFNLGIKCSNLIPDVLCTHTASGLSSFGFNCLASPHILESPMIHFFFFDLTTGICLVKFALSSLSDRSLMVCVKSLLLLLLVVLLHSVELLSLLFFSLFLTFWLSKSFLFGCLLSILVLFLTVLFCLVCFVRFLFSITFWPFVGIALAQVFTAVRVLMLFFDFVAPTVSHALSLSSISFL